MGLIVTEFSGHPTLPATCGIVECWNGIVRNQLRRLLSLCPLPFLGADPLVRQFGYLIWLSPEGFNSFWQLLVNDEDKRSRDVHRPILKI